MSRLFLHVGTPKTGTTFLQSVMWRNRDVAKQQGLLLPLRSVHAHFRAVMDLREAAELTAHPAEVPGTWDRMVADAEGWAGDVLVSHEMMVWVSPEQAARAVASFAAQGREAHVVITARDLARQLPAEWQERAKARATLPFGDFIERARIEDEPTGTAQHLWTAQDVAALARRWSGAVPPERIHVVTVPPPGAPRGLLWERFAGLLGLDPAAFSLDVARANESIGVEQAELLRRLNIALGDRIPRPGPYPGVVKGAYAHGILSARPGTRLTLAGDDLEFARERSARMVRELEELGVAVVGDLAELQVTEPPSPGEVSSARVEVPTERLLEEAIEGTIGLLERLHQVNTDHARKVRELRQEADRWRRQATRVEAERDALADAPVSHAVQAVRHRVGGAARRVRSTVARRVRGSAEPGESGRRRVYFLMFHVDGKGGVARTTINLANALADHYDVTILSLFRGRSDLVFPVDPRVTVRFVTRNRANQRHFRHPENARLAATPSVLAHLTRDHYTALTDLRLREALAEVGPDDVVITTRPSLHLMAAHFLPDDVPLIGWDHMNFPTRYGSQGASVGRLIDQVMPRLDAYVVLTEADARDYRERLPGAPVHVIRNSVAWEPAEPWQPHDQKVVVAAGRLHPVKGFERLVEAWQLLTPEFPDWTCRIYGAGGEAGALQRQIDQAGVKVELAGYSDDMRTTLREAAVYTMTSRREGFPMTLIEALSQGTPLVAFDCPRGPGEIIVDGSNGRLVPDGDVKALAEALAELMRDPALRERMGRQALRDSRQYAVSSIAGDWIRLIDDVTATPEARN